MLATSERMADNSIFSTFNSGSSMAMRPPVARAASSPTKRRMVQPDNTLEYCVKQNETLESVAAQFNTTPSEVCRLNRLAVRMIFPGQLLFVPEPPSSSNAVRMPSNHNSPRKSVDLTSSSSLHSLSQQRRRASEVSLTPAQKNFLAPEEVSFASSGTTGSADSLTLRLQQHAVMSSPHEEDEFQHELEVGASASALHQQQPVGESNTLRKSPTGGQQRAASRMKSEENEMLTAVNNAGRHVASSQKRSNDSRQISADEMRRLDEECLAKFLKMQAKYIISHHHSHSRPSSRATSPPPSASIQLSAFSSSTDKVDVLLRPSTTGAESKPSIVSSTTSSTESSAAIFAPSPTNNSKLFGAVDGVLLITPNAIMFDPDVSDPLCIRNGVDKYGVITPLEHIVSVAIYKSIATARQRRPRRKFKNALKSEAGTVGGDGNTNPAFDDSLPAAADAPPCDITQDSSRRVSARQFHYPADIGGGSVGDLEEIPEEADVVSGVGTPRERSEHDLLSLQLAHTDQTTTDMNLSSRPANTESENSRLAAHAPAAPEKKRSPSPSSARALHRRTPSDGGTSDNPTASSSRKSSGGSSSSSSTAASALSSKFSSSIFTPLKNAAKKTLSTTSSNSDQLSEHHHHHPKHVHSEKNISVTIERRKTPSPALLQNQQPVERKSSSNRVQFDNSAKDVSGQPTAKRTLFQKASSLTVLPITAMSKSVVGTASNFLSDVASSVTPSNLTAGSGDVATARQAADVRNASPKPGETFLQWRQRASRTSMKSTGSAGEGVSDDQTIGDNETFVMVTASSPPADDATINKIRQGSQSPEDMRRSASADPRTVGDKTGEDAVDGPPSTTTGRARSSSDQSAQADNAAEVEANRPKISETKQHSSLLSSLRISLKPSLSPTTMKQSSSRTTKTTVKSGKQPVSMRDVMGNVVGAAILPLSDVKKQQIGFMPTITAADCPALFRSITELLPKKHGDDLSESGDCVYLLVKLHPHKRHQASRLQHVSLGPVQGFHHKKLKSEYWFRIARHYSQSVYSFFMHWRPEMSDGSESTGDEHGFILYDVHSGAEQQHKFSEEQPSSASDALSHPPRETTDSDVANESDDDTDSSSIHSGSSYSTPASSETSEQAASENENAAGDAPSAQKLLAADGYTVITSSSKLSGSVPTGESKASKSSKSRHIRHSRQKSSRLTEAHQHQPLSASPSASSTASSAAVRLKKQKDAAQRYRRVSEQALHQFEIADGQKKQKRSVDLSHLSCEWEVVALDEAMRRATVIDSFDHHLHSMDATKSPVNGEKADKSSNNSVNDEAGAANIADFEPELIDAEQSLFQQQPELLRMLSNPVVLPARAQGYPWRMIYNTAIHGFSLKSLYRNMQPVNELYTTAPFCVLIICDTDNHIFGAVLSQPLKMSDVFYGTGESFVFTFVPKFRHFMWTGENSFFVKGTKEALFIGASDGNFGIWLDGDLYHGRSQRCATFDNDALVPGSGDFVVKAVEAWAIY